MTSNLFRKRIPPASALFDVHANALPPGVASPPGFDGRQSLDALAAPEISRALVGPPAMVAYAHANAALRAWAADTGGRFLPMARIGGGGGPRPIREAWQARAALRAMSTKRPADVDTLAGFAAIKLTPHLDGLPARSLLAEIRRRKLPVLVHSGAMCPPAWLAHHLLPHLEGPLILAHLGRLALCCRGPARCRRARGFGRPGLSGNQRGEHRELCCLCGQECAP